MRLFNLSKVPIIFVAAIAGISMLVVGLQLLGQRNYSVTLDILPSPTSVLFHRSQPMSFPPITTQAFFDNQLILPDSGDERDQVIELLVTGDVLTARSVHTRTRKNADWAWAWRNTATELSAADITFINLETPLVQDCPARDDGMIFCGSSEHVQGLQFAGVDVVNFANNHAGNWGIEGVRQTLQSMKVANISIAGIVDEPLVVFEAKGTKFAFLSFNDVDVQVGVYRAQEEEIAAQIAGAQQVADVVIVQFHWGAEYTYAPSDRQKVLARFAVDQGADLVVGNHPHWFQPVEAYNDVAIMYSHGNFIFDQMWSRETREGVVGKYYFYQGKLIDGEFLPILIEDYGRPRWLEGAERERVIEKLEDISVLGA